ncbi:zinc transport system substrate-binding protein [Paenibacillus sp. DS2015]|uniref:metal ABC transporter substrate-binding protein n=1 Tax=Paenibacillus sp. DS2015 TaxID=3373917 RepID=UPI003D1907B0
MKLSKQVVVALLFSIVLVVSGCGSNSGKNASTTDTPAESGDTSASGDKLNVQVSFYPMYEFTKTVAGDLADVESLVPAGIEPHDWEPTPRDLAKIQDADVLVYNGAGLEGWMDQVTSAVNNDKLIQIEASHGITTMEGSEEEEAHDHEGEEAHEHEEEEAHNHGGLDPHVWLSPVLAIQEVRNIESGLSEAAPEHKDEFKKNADAYIVKLEQLDQDFKSGLNDTKRKDFITQHASFGYLAKEYNLVQIAIAGLSPEQEPSAADMATIVKFAKENNVQTIFFETLASSKVAETIAKEIGAGSAVLNPIEGLTDEDKANKLDYIGIMRQNLEALKKALNQ